MRRKKGGYFTPEPEAPAAVSLRIRRRVSFSDVDAMGVLWHGRYPLLFEAANEELGRRCGMTYDDFFRERLRAPIVQFHVDHFAPLRLGEEAIILGRMIWNDGARMNLEYEVFKEDGVLAATGYTVQMFVDEQGTPLLVSPPLWETCRCRWRNGEFASLQ